MHWHFLLIAHAHAPSAQPELKEKKTKPKGKAHGAKKNIQEPPQMYLFGGNP
jgi:hypothetical protein